ncbi:MAG: dTDP-3-amino-3,6-dideoxy-alpha-D-galactopyranose transaminase [Candidatus Omnitrophica bacterium ADurb.Bin277]|nr:MAG: dTDP-3-amino-3,6-dideoxy-alpha-D-galactopyranose transaminase [Candidatus Omnitrophica bacterium ADurb.Bin277]
MLRQIKVIPRRKIKFYPNEDLDILKAIFSPGFPAGSQISLFERVFSEYLGGGEAVATCSGRQALKLILESQDLREGDEILFPAYTLFDLVKMIEEMKLKPVFADIDPKTFNMSPEAVAQKITPKTRVIVATHIFGVPCRIQEICRLADAKGIMVVEDCAHALGAESRGRKVGNFGKAAFFSFSMGKQINAFGGGMIYSPDKKIIGFCRSKIFSYIPGKIETLASATTAYLERIAVLPFFSKLLLGSRKHVEFFIEFYRKTKNKTRAWNKSLSPLQSMIGRKQLEGIGKDLEIREARARLYRDLLSGNFLFQEVAPGDISANCYFVVRSKKKCPLGPLAQALIKAGVDVGICGEIMDHCPKALGVSANDYPVTDMAEAGNLLLPFYSDLDEKEIRYIAATANKMMESLSTPS